MKSLGKIVVYGCTSGMAQAFIRRMARSGAEMFLVGRSAEKVDCVATDAQVRGAKVHTWSCDLADVTTHQTSWNKAKEALGTIDSVLLAYGTLPDGERCATDATYAYEQFVTNGGSYIHLLTIIAASLAEQQSGTIGVITSVSGDRGRKAIYLYGSAKSAVSTFTEGQRLYYRDKNVHITTIKPGFVDTPMTAHLKKGLLFASADSAAKSIISAMVRKKGTVYVPFFWRYIMAIIKAIPEFIFRRMKF